MIFKKQKKDVVGGIRGKVIQFSEQTNERKLKKKKENIEEVKSVACLTAICGIESTFFMFALWVNLSSNYYDPIAIIFAPL
jgi:hypothetical protein